MHHISQLSAKYCRSTLLRWNDVWQISRSQPASCVNRVVRETTLHSITLRLFSSGRKHFVLGIETSCDDTGAAVVDENGTVIGEALNSQTSIHVKLGGIIPPIARDLHVQNIEKVITDALADAQMTLQDVSAVAVTVRPGLALSLLVGLQYAKSLVQQSGKPLIPIHHMEAHALTVRMIHRVEFPYLTLLVSGGHCLLAVVRDVDDFLLLGHGTDDSPGDAFDKTARRLKLKNLSEFDGLSGGASIEIMGRGGNPRAFDFPGNIMSQHRHCDFSFSGLKFKAHKIIDDEEKKEGTLPGAVMSSAADLCASFQYAVLRHLAQRVQRALLFCDLKKLLPERKTLVVSGGVASNQFIRSGLEKVCSQYNCEVVCPPPKLCTDNGMMIAWNGMEKWLRGRGVVEDLDSVDIQPRCPLGVDITEEVNKAYIKSKRLKLL